MGRNLVALLVVGFAFWRGDLLHPNPFYALWLPLIGLVSFLYLMTRLLRPGGRSGTDAGSSGGDGGWCDSDGGGCGGDGGGGGD